jgi:ketosteroid isomerase-like protein
MANDVAKIKQTLRQFSAACTAGDSDGVMKTFANGVVFMPPDSPRISGKRAVGAWAQTAVFDQVRQKLRVDLGHAEISGAQAWVTGSFRLEITPKAGGSTVKGMGKHMAVFKKQKDGSWKYAQAIWNFDKPPA